MTAANLRTAYGALYPSRGAARKIPFHEWAVPRCGMGSTNPVKLLSHLVGIMQARGPMKRVGRPDGWRYCAPVGIAVDGVATGFVWLEDLVPGPTIGAAQGKKLVLFGNAIDVHAMMPWVDRFAGVAELVGPPSRAAS